MVTCEAISTISSFADLLVWPTSCNYYFYLFIFEFLFGFIAWSSYKGSESKGRDNLFSSLGVSSLVILVVGVIGSLIKNSSSVAMVHSGILIILVAQFIVCVALWRVKS